MARFYLLDALRTAAGVLPVGKMVDDAVVDVAALRRAGASLAADSVVVAEAAAAVTEKRRRSAIDERTARSAMLSALGASVLLPRISIYADEPNSIVTGASVGDGVALVEAGIAKIVTGTPRLIDDTVVVGTKAIRTGVSDAISAPARTADSLIAGDSCVLLVWRARKFNFTGSSYPILDTTEGGTVPGYQILAREDYAFGDYRRFEVRIWDGSAWHVQLPGSQNGGHWIPLKWHVIVVRLTATTLDVRIDGRYVDVVPESISLTFPAMASGKVTLGHGPSDYKALEVYDSAPSDSDTEAIEHRAERRFRVDMIKRIVGDLRLPASATSYVGFPGLTLVPGNSLRCTYFVGATESENGNRVDVQSSDDFGANWKNVATINESSPSNCLANINITVLSNGDWVGSSYEIASASIQHLMLYRSTDEGASWTVTHVPPLGGAAWEGSSAFIVEDEDVPGKLHWGVYTSEGGTYYHAWDYVSLDYGHTWLTRNHIGDGDADQMYYAEPQIIRRDGEWYAIIRNAAPPDFFASPNEMQQSRSVDGVTWEQPVTTTLQADSAGQGLLHLASGADVLVMRPGGRRMAALAYRAPGAAWDDPWSNIVPAPGALWLDFIYGGFGGMSYGTIVERPVVQDFPSMDVAWGATTDANHDDVCIRRNVYEFYLTLAMPGGASPQVATVTSLVTQQIETRGAGDCVFAFTSNPTGSSISPSGVFTGGGIDGTSEFTVHDCNGKLLETCSYTVTGGVGVFPPDTLSNLSAWFAADTGVTPNAGHAAAVAAKGGTVEASMAQSNPTAQPTIVASGIGGIADLTYDGDDSLIGSSALVTSDDQVTLFFIFQFTSIGTMLLWGMQYNAFHAAVFSNYNGTSPGQLSFVLSGATVVTTPAAYNDGLPHVCVARADLIEGTAAIFVDSAAAAVVTGAPSGTFTNGAGDLNAVGASTGAGPTQDRFYTGHLPEWGAYSDSKDGADVAKLITYMRLRAGI